MRIAIIGSGIAGLSTAYMLRNVANIDIYEKSAWLGGHTRTVSVSDGIYNHNVDMGFIVFNRKNYPKFTKLLNKLEVECQPTTMSFSVSNRHIGLEYNGTNIRGLFAQKRNLLNFKYLNMLLEIKKLNKLAKDFISEGYSMTLGDFIKKNKLGEYLTINYLIPMVSSIWSNSRNDVMHCCAKFIFTFLNNHGMLNINDRPNWRVVTNGSKSYVIKIAKEVRANIYTETYVKEVKTLGKEVIVNSPIGEKKYDYAVIASHSEDVLRMLTNATAQEKEIFNSLKYKNNSVVLHTDTSVLPKNKRAWAAWNYIHDYHSNNSCNLSYNMNILQNLNSNQTYCVSINQDSIININKVICRHYFAHPYYELSSEINRAKHLEISGKRNIFYCGAYWGSGFHEDGVQSALHISKQLGGETL